MKYYDLCKHLEALGPYMSDVIGKCRRHVLAFQGTGPSRIDKYLSESATYAAAQQKRDLKSEFAKGTHNPGFLVYLEDRKSRCTVQFPVLVNETAGIIKQKNGEQYGLMEDVWDCLHFRDANNELHHWRQANGKAGEAAVPSSEAEDEASDSRKSNIGTQDPKIGRRVQSQWRQRVEQLYGSRCQVTNCEHRALLRGSHIKRWADSTTEERLDANNGLILAAHIDAAFEVGLLSFDDKGHVLISSKLSPHDRKVLQLSGEEQIPDLTPASRKYLAWHRERHGF